VNQSEYEVGALLESRVEASRAKDIDRLMSLYSPDIIYFDVVPPLQFIGPDAVRRNFVRWFNEYEGPIGLETDHLKIAVSGDVAFAHMLHLDTGTMRSDGGPTEQTPGRTLWLRSTVCCQRSGGKWLITHEHISLPVDLASMRAVLDIAP
jgi:ketosteroid isomerase-like protein